MVRQGCVFPITSQSSQTEINGRCRMDNPLLLGVSLEKCHLKAVFLCNVWKKYFEICHTCMKKCMIFFKIKSLFLNPLLLGMCGKNVICKRFDVGGNSYLLNI